MRARPLLRGVVLRDIEGLTTAMIKVATDRGLNERMGNAARERGALKNTWDDHAGRLLDILANAKEGAKQ